MTAWFRERPENIGQAACQLANRLRDEQAERRTKDAAAIAIYNGEQADPNTVERFKGPQQEISPQQAWRLDVQLAKSIIQTALAKIAAKQRPKGVVLTRGAKFHTRVMAKRASKWGEALLHHRQGAFANSFDLFVQLMLDCMRWEAGVVKVYGDKERKTIIHERCFSRDILVDQYDAEFGQPQTLIHMQRYDRDNLAARFPKHREAIMQAKSYPYEGEGNVERADQHVAVYDCYRLPLSPSLPGRHVIVVDAMDGLLVDEDWTREEFPFAMLLWDRNATGIWSTPLIDVIAPIQACCAGLLNALEENVEATCGGFIDAEENSVDEAKVQSNTALKIMWRRSGTAPLNVHMPAPFHPLVLQFIEMLRGMAYEMTGVNEMSAQGRKDPGITANVALRTMNDIQTERFLTQARAFEQLAVDVLRLDLAAAHELAEQGISVIATMPRNGGLDTVDFMKFRDAVKAGEVTIQPASASDDTLAARKQLITEFAEAGYIKPEVAEELLQSVNVDVEALGKRELAQQRWLEQLIAKFEEFEPGKDDSQEVFEPPDPLMNLELGIMTMTDAYFEFKADGAPDANKRLILDWIEQADALIAKRDGAAAPAAGPPGMPPPEAMPPMDPMMDPAMGDPMAMPPMPPDMPAAPPMM